MSEPASAGTRTKVAAFLLAAGAAWSAGNVGPVVAPLAEELSASLSKIGLLSGTFFFAGVVAAGFAGAELSQRVSLRTGLIACCLLAFAGNAIFAASPGFGGLVAGRVLSGLGLGFAFLFGGAFARAEGGPRLVGVFGAGITLGVAFALGVGSVLEDAGVDWRVGFALAAVLGLSALPFLPRDPAAPPTRQPSGGLLREALPRPAFWRLLTLGASVFAVPLIVGAWLVHYLATVGDVAVGVAGLLSFALFGVSAVMRDLGGTLLERGAPPGLLALGSLATGAAGVAVVGIDPSLAPAAVAVVLMGIGLSLPYALIYEEGERILPDHPLGGLGLIQSGSNTLPIAVVPLVGAALAAGSGEAAFLALAAFVVVAGLLNARAAVGPA